MPSPALPMALAALAGVLVSMGLLLLGVVTLLWNKLDKRFDELKAAMKEDRDRLDQRFDRLETDVRAILEAVAPVKQR